MSFERVCTRAGRCGLVGSFRGLLALAEAGADQASWRTVDTDGWVAWRWRCRPRTCGSARGARERALVGLRRGQRFGESEIALGSGRSSRGSSWDAVFVGLVVFVASKGFETRSQDAATAAQEQAPQLTCKTRASLPGLATGYPPVLTPRVAPVVAGRVAPGSASACTITASPVPLALEAAVAATGPKVAP